VIQFLSLSAASPFTTDNHDAAANSTAIAGSLVNACCTAILAQPDIVVASMPSLAKHQDTSRTHANLWINTVQPGLITAIGGVVGFSNQYNAFLLPLLQAAPNVNTNPVAKRTVIEGLQLLKQSATSYQLRTQQACASIDTFRSDFVKDNSAFTGDIETIRVKLTGDNGEIKELTKKIEAEQTAMTTDLNMIAGGATMMVVGGLMIAVGALAEIPSGGASTALIVAGGVVVAGGAILTGFGGSDYRVQLANYKRDIEQLATDQAEVTLLQHVKGQLTGMNTQIEGAATALNSMEAAWQGLNTEFDNLLDQVAQTDVNSAYLQAQLAAAGTDWNDMATQARKVQDMVSPPQVPLAVVLQIAA
jgi:non-hemolytic enterotoxin B/C